MDFLSLKESEAYRNLLATNDFDGADKHRGRIELVREIHEFIKAKKKPPEEN